jgi:beta-galactosidase
MEAEGFQLAVEVDGRAPLHFEWFHDSRPLQGESGACLTVVAALPSSSGRYACRVTNKHGAAMSRSANVTVASAAPEIVVQPEGCAVLEGSQLGLSVKAVGRPPLRYRWLHEGKPLAQQSASMWLPSVTAADGGRYVCEVSSAWGSVLSTAALVVVEEVGGEPLIMEHPR